MYELPLLLIPEKTDPETQKIMDAWIKKGGAVRRLGKYWIKNEEIAAKKIVLYGNQTFSLVLAQIYNVQLISPDDTLIARLDQKWTGRLIKLKKLNDISSQDFPLFVKPVIPKLFQAQVFHDPYTFEQAASGLKGDEEVLASGILHITAEARSFVMDGEVMDLALYEGRADLEKGKKFLLDFITEHKKDLPHTLVIDLAYGPKTGWFVLEFNASWGAGLNGCEAEKVMDCIASATSNN